MYAIERFGVVHPTLSFAFEMAAYGALAFFFIFIASAIVLMFWIYRAAANLHSVQRDALAFSPGWAVGWNFVPIACFWKPFDVVRQIWFASCNMQKAHREPLPSMFHFWWGCWLAALIINWSGAFNDPDPGILGISSTEMASVTGFYSALAASCFFLFRIVREITRAQKTLMSNTASVFE